jgi:hypothetical protein
MLDFYKLYKTKRGFVSFEQEDGEMIQAYHIDKRGTFKPFIKVSDEDAIKELVSTLKMTEATDFEYAKIALFRVNDDMRRGDEYGIE